MGEFIAKASIQRWIEVREKINKFYVNRVSFLILHRRTNLKSNVWPTDRTFCGNIISFSVYFRIISSTTDGWVNDDDDDGRRANLNVTL